MWWMVLTAALASDGFELVRTAHDCAISMRPEDHAQGAAMRAQCTWPEGSVAQMAAQLSDFSRYTEYVYPIDISRVERVEGDRMLVYQRQRVFGIADREVLLWMWTTTAPERFRVAWNTADDEPLVLQSKSVRVPRSVGFWEVVPHEDGGVQVVHEIAMDAGGSIPRWLVNLVRTRGFARVMGDVRRLMVEGDG